MKKSHFVLLVALCFVPFVSFASIDTNLKYGSRGSEVAKLQEFLIQKGFLKTEATGNFFSQTRKAVVAYQESIGLPNTGYVGPMTRAKINDESHLQTVATTTAPKPKTISAISTSTSTSTSRIGTPTITSSQTNTVTPSTISGCTSTTGYSMTTGLPCSGASQAPAPTIDVCNNIAGVQTLAPAGTYIDNGNCISTFTNTTSASTLDTTQAPSAFTPPAPPAISW